MILVSINGEPKTLKPDTTITKMLQTLGYDTAWLGVAINTAFVSKAKHDTTIIKAGDQIEILSPIAGG